MIFDLKHQLLWQWPEIHISKGFVCAQILILSNTLIRLPKDMINESKKASIRSAKGVDGKTYSTVLLYFIINWAQGGNYDLVYLKNTLKWGKTSAY